MRFIASLVMVAGLAWSADPQTALFENAVAALSKGDYTAAERGFQEILRNSPNHVPSWQNLGLVYARTGRFERSVATYRHALELSPGNASVLLNLGLAYMKEESYAQALPVFETLFTVEPGSLSVRDIHLLYPLSAGYLRQNRTEEAPRRLQTFLSTVPPAAANLVLCKLSYIGERLDRAEDQCRKTLALDPNFAGAHLELAKVLLNQRSPEAGKELNAAIQEDPSDPEAVYDLGAALLQDGRVQESLQYLDRAQRLNPGFWGSYFNLGKAKLQLNQAEQAVPLLQKAAELNSTSFSVFYELGRALMAVGKTEEAHRAMDRVRELNALELENDAKAVRKQ
jgi:tetratricopeptide (TPR) repeat protein